LGGELSGATLVDVECDHSRANTEPYTETLGCQAPEDALEGEVARGQDARSIRNGPRIQQSLFDSDSKNWLRLDVSP